MGFPTLVRCHVYIESGPRSSITSSGTKVPLSSSAQWYRTFALSVQPWMRQCCHNTGCCKNTTRQVSNLWLLNLSADISGQSIDNKCHLDGNNVKHFLNYTSKHYQYIEWYVHIDNDIFQLNGCRMQCVDMGVGTCTNEPWNMISPLHLPYFS